VPEIIQPLDPTILTWRIKEQPDFTMVELRGDLSESAELDRLRRRLKGHVVIHLGGIRRVNSGGVREWVNFISALCKTNPVTLTHCSPSVVAQLNMIFNFRAHAGVRSFLAPYTCTRCDCEVEKLVDIETHFPDRNSRRMPEFTCDACGGAMEFDEVPDRYLSFLQDV
jgi:eukaryotic-like serine/threonine-protein kinase